MQDLALVLSGGGARAAYQVGFLHHVASRHPDLVPGIITGVSAGGIIATLLGMTTRGDQILDRTLSKIGGKGLFVKELETALAEGRAQLAVHSLKDVPMELPEGFVLAAVLEREDPRDAFVANDYASLAELPQGAVVGSSSLRRVTQLLSLRPDLRVEPLRGNLDTRLRKLRDRLNDRLHSHLDELYINGSIEHRLPHNLNISFAYVEGESLLMGINDVAVSSGSACTSASLEPSYVLKALGAGDDLAHSSIRFGLGRWSTQEEVDYVADKLVNVVTRLREMSPLYELAKEGVDLSTMQWQTEGH